MPYLTIITPTYNRGKLLKKCYESLCGQSCNDFQWLIIDDGSTDNTKNVVNQFLQNSNLFKIDYYYKTNGGKHSALNYSHKYIEAEIVLILDSDDILSNDAVSMIKKYWEKYKNESIIGVLSFLRGKDSEHPLSSPYPQDIIRSNYVDFRINRKIKGDCCEILRTAILKEFPFPIFKDERFMSEGYLWAKSSKYDTVYINKIIYLADYLEDGLTKSGRKLRIKNPEGGICTSELFLSSEFNMLCRIKHMMLYICYSLFAHRKINTIVKKCQYKFLCLLSMPFGVAIYLCWKYKYNK